MPTSSRAEYLLSLDAEAQRELLHAMSDEQRRAFAHHWRLCAHDGQRPPGEHRRKDDRLGDALTVDRHADDLRRPHLPREVALELRLACDPKLADRGNDVSRLQSRAERRIVGPGRGGRAARRHGINQRARASRGVG